MSLNGFRFWNFSGGISVGLGGEGAGNDGGDVIAVSSGNITTGTESQPTTPPTALESWLNLLEAVVAVVASMSLEILQSVAAMRNRWCWARW